MYKFRQQIASDLALKLKLKKVQQVEEQLEVPGQRKFGHFAFPCFSLAKRQKKKPQEVAKKLAGELKDCEQYTVQAVGPYVNFTVKAQVLASETLQQIFLSKEKYGTSDQGDGRTVVIEYSSPNIAKPFGIGHLRSTNIGSCLARIYSFLGYRVIRINHLGDWGTQFGKLITAYKRFGSADFLKERPLVNLYQLYVRYHQEEEQDPSLADEARDWFSKLERGDEEALELWEWFRDLSVQQFNKTYQLLGVGFDYTWGESFYRDKTDSTVARLKEKSLLERSQEALIVRFKEEELPPLLIRKSDDSTLYATRDLCAAEYRHEKFNFDRMLYVVGSPQKLHFRQVFLTLRMMGHEWADRLAHVDFGHLSLAGAKAAMSSRKGNIVLLQDVIDQASEMARKLVDEKNPQLENKDEIAQQVGIGAVLFADLGSRRQKEVKFSWDEILNFEGETGPYLQYAYVRMRSLDAKYSGWVDLDVDLSLLNSEAEADLIYHLASLQKSLEKVSLENEPFFLARYLVELAKLFSRFYHDCRVIDAESEELSRARMLLVNCSAIVLKTGLNLLGISTPEKM